MSRTSDDLSRWTASPAGDVVCQLGEGPVWDAPRERVLWVDIASGTVHAGRLAPGEDVVRIDRTDSWAVDVTVGAVAVTGPGDLLVAGEHRLVTVDARGGLRPGPRLLPEGSPRRLNDGACDPAGRFLVGSLHRGEVRGGEELVRLEQDGSLTVLDDDLDLSNGLAWSPDGREFYSTDTLPGVVWARDYDPGTGEVGPRRELIRITGGGSPDGLCVDAEGCLWIAMYGGGQVRRYSPDGVLIGVVELGAPHVTCPAFVGPDLDVLLITTATENLDADRVAAHPGSGRLFAVRTGVRGLPTTFWQPVPAP